MKSKVGIGAIVAAVFLLVLVIGGIAYTTYFRTSIPMAETLTPEQKAKQDEAMKHLTDGSQPNTTLTPGGPNGMPLPGPASTPIAPAGGAGANGVPPPSSGGNEPPPPVGK